MRYLFNIDWMDPHSWDLVINTGRFSVDEAVQIIVGGGGERRISNPPRSTGSACRIWRSRVASKRPSSAIRRSGSTGSRSWRRTARVRIEGEVITEEDRDAVEQIVRADRGRALIVKTICECSHRRSPACDRARSCPGVAAACPASGSARTCVSHHRSARGRQADVRTRDRASAELQGGLRGRSARSHVSAVPHDPARGSP